MKWKVFNKKSRLHDGEYIVYSNQWSGVHEARFENNKWHDDRGRGYGDADIITDDVSHYMPFPTPPLKK